MDFEKLLSMTRPVIKAAAAFSAKDSATLARLNVNEQRYRQRQKEEEDEETRRQTKEALSEAYAFASTPNLTPEAVNEYMGQIKEKFPNVDSTRVMESVYNTVTAMRSHRGADAAEKRRGIVEKRQDTQWDQGQKAYAQGLIDDKTKRERDDIKFAQGKEKHRADLAYTRAQTNKANSVATTVKPPTPAAEKYNIEQRATAFAAEMNNAGLQVTTTEDGYWTVGASDKDGALKTRQLARKYGFEVQDNEETTPDNLLGYGGKTSYNLTIFPGVGPVRGGGAAPATAQGGSPGGGQAPGDDRPPLGTFEIAEGGDPSTAPPAHTNPVNIRKAVRTDPALKAEYKKLKAQGKTRKEVIAILAAEGTKARNPQEAVYGRRAEPDSLVDKLQGAVGRQQRSEFKKSGESEIEFALRKVGAGKSHGHRKRMARNLRKNAKGMSDEQIAQMIMEDGAGVRQVAGAK